MGMLIDQEGRLSRQVKEICNAIRHPKFAMTMAIFFIFYLVACIDAVYFSVILNVLISGELLLVDEASELYLMTMVENARWLVKGTYASLFLMLCTYWSHEIRLLYQLASRHMARKGKTSR